MKHRIRRGAHLDTTSTKIEYNWPEAFGDLVPFANLRGAIDLIVCWSFKRSKDLTRKYQGKIRELISS